MAVHEVLAFVPVLYSDDAHGVHVASAVLSEDAVKYVPGAHSVFFEVHEVSALVPVLYSDAMHGVHVASAEESAEPVKYWPAAHSSHELAPESVPVSAIEPATHALQ